MSDLFQKQNGQGIKLNKLVNFTTPEELDNKIETALQNFKSLPTEGNVGQILSKTEEGSEWIDNNPLPTNGTAGQVLTKTEDGSSWQTFSAKSNNIGYSETLPESVPEGFAENGLWISNDGDDENSFLTKAQVKALIQDEILKLGLNSLANSAKYEGSDVPSDSLGKDGDFYIQIDGKVD